MRDVLKDLADQFWPRDAVADGAVGVDAPVFGNVSVGEAREAGVLHNADSSVLASELLDHAYRDFHGVVDDIVHADRVHAVDGQAGISVEAYPGGHGRLERVSRVLLCLRPGLMSALLCNIFCPRGVLSF